MQQQQRTKWDTALYSLCEQTHRRVAYDKDLAQPRGDVGGGACVSSKRPYESMHASG
jgi:hypothetical protein